MKRNIPALLCAALMVILLAVGVRAENPDGWVSLYTCPGDHAQARILPIEGNGEELLVLPAGMDPSAVPLYFELESGADALHISGEGGEAVIASGDEVDLPALCGGGDYRITLEGENLPARSLHILPGDGAAALFLFSQDPENQGRAWVEASPDKTNKALGSMLLLNEAGDAVYDGGLTQIKGRGNSTWRGAKRPYQIKLETKTDLLESGVKNNAAKTWVLLADYYDASCLRNLTVAELAQALGVETRMEQRPVALYYDGEYRGLYLLSEKVEVAKGRVNITDLVKENEKVNKELPETFPAATDLTENGAFYVYREGMASPEQITGGYLLEMDYASRAVEEASYFRTRRGNYVVVKSPEFASREEMDYIASLYQEMEDALYSGGENRETGKPLWDYLDRDSALRVYLISELTQNQDAYYSSAFLYKDADRDSFVMEPLWDYDLALGNSYYPDLNEGTGYYCPYYGFGKALYEVEEFRAEMVRMLSEELLPLLKVWNDQGFDSLKTRLSAACLADSALWGKSKGESWEPAAEKLRDYLTKRTAWMEAELERCGYAPEYFLFRDTPETAWYYEPLREAVRLELFKGTMRGYFKPFERTTRAEAVQVLFRLAGDPGTEYRPLFSDVQNGAWYAEAVLWAADHGVVNGTPAGKFLPNSQMTRQDLVTVLYRLSGSPEVEEGLLEEFPDADFVSVYARPAMAWAVEQGIIRGQGTGALAPREGTTRAELAVIIMRFAQTR